MPETKRILAIDPGERRVGLAVSDPLGITAQGLDTFDRRSGDLLGHLRGIVEAYEVGEIVVGHPVSMSGRPSEASISAGKLAEEIERELKVPTRLWDERLTSVEARRTLAGSRAPKGAADRIAAVLILQSYLGYLEGADSGEP